jgi:hypothetical protein
MPSWAISIHPAILNPISERYILMFPLNLRLRFQNCLLPSCCRAVPQPAPLPCYLATDCNEPDLHKYSNVSTVKHNSCIHYYVKIFLQGQHVSTQLRGHHQASTVMKLKMAIHKQLVYLRDPIWFTYNIKYTYTFTLVYIHIYVYFV